MYGVGSTEASAASQLSTMSAMFRDIFAGGQPAEVAADEGSCWPPLG
jgi:hypothetical protein